MTKYNDEMSHLMTKAKIDLDAGIVRMTERLNNIISEAKSALSKAESCERKGERWMALSHGVGAVGSIVRDIGPLRNYWFGKFLEEGYAMERKTPDFDLPLPVRAPSAAVFHPAE